MIYHPHDQENAINSNRFAKLIHAADRQYKDGYNNIKYKVVSVEKKENIYTNITIDVGSPESEKLEKQQKLDAQKLLLQANKVNNDDISINDNESVNEEEFEVSMQAICLTVLFIIYSLYKSRIVHYFFKQHNRHFEKTRSSGRRRKLSKKYERVTQVQEIESSSETEPTDDNETDEPLLKSGKGKRQHSRSQSVPFIT